MHTYANTNKSHPYALKITSALTNALYKHATCIIHNAHNFKQITHLHVHAITDPSSLFTMHTNHTCSYK